MKKTAFAVSLLVLLSQFTIAQESIIPLYPNQVPNSLPHTLPERTEKPEDGISRLHHVTIPTLTLFRPAKEKATGTAVIICPGGGYGILAIDHEGYQVAKRFNEIGVTAFVLKYRLPNDKAQPNKTIAPLQDAQQALRLVRKRAAEFNVNPNRIGILGFSAGGHLAATAGTHFQKPVGERAEPGNVRPDFMILVYPVISFTDSLTHEGSRANLLGKNTSPEQIRLYSNELQVTAHTPPTLLVHSGDDQTVKVQNSLAFYLACVQQGVPAELHIYSQGGHGYGMQNKTTPDQWTDRVQNWMQANGWLAK